MSDTQHAPEPWEVHEGLDYCHIYGGEFNHSGNPIAECYKNDANTRRIVAAVNACKGISTEALEGGVVNDLLEACKKANTCASIPDYVMDLIRAAIAKAKGGE